MDQPKSSLVSITHRDGARVPIPHIGGRTPMLRESVPHRIVDLVREVGSRIGIEVEVHVLHYDRDAEQAARIREEARRHARHAPRAAPAAEHREPEPPEPPAPAEPPPLSLEELRARVEGLRTLAEAAALVAEQSIDLGPGAPTTLKGIRQTLLEMIDQAAAEDAAA